MEHIAYHLQELEIALAENDNRKILPEIMNHENMILDIGCGIGQTFVGLKCFQKTCIGIDIDEEAIEYGKEKYGEHIEFIYASAENLPFEDNTFDLVFSRVSLPYTNIPQVIQEIKRILKLNGRVWITLHEQGRVYASLKKSLESPYNIKKFIHCLYILLNGYFLKYFTWVFPFINGKYESWQDPKSMQKILENQDFETKVYYQGKHTIIEGYLRSTS